MSRGVDGIVAEVYAEAIAKWASYNPSFLISVLEQQSQTIRKAVLSFLDFGFGIGKSPERQKFELFLEKLSSNNLVLQDWRAATKAYKN